MRGLERGRIASASIGPDDRVVELVASGDDFKVVLDGKPAGSIGRRAIAIG
jgi:hypothetical protein